MAPLALHLFVPLFVTHYLSRGKEGCLQKVNQFAFVLLYGGGRMVDFTGPGPG